MEQMILAILPLDNQIFLMTFSNILQAYKMFKTVETCIHHLQNVWKTYSFPFYCPSLPHLCIKNSISYINIKLLPIDSSILGCYF